MRKRFLKNGLDGFADHEVLELLLSFGIPRKNTNDIAHLLMKTFHSLPNVIEADYERLCSVCGMGENSAVLIMLVKELMRRYLVQRMEKHGGNLTREERLEYNARYLVNEFVGFSEEVLMVMPVKNSLEAITVVPFSNSSVSTVTVDPAELCNIAAVNKACGIILAHNHPGGNVEPSYNDMQSTEMIRRKLKVMNISLVEHFIICDNEYNGLITGCRGAVDLK